MTVAKGAELTFTSKMLFECFSSFKVTRGDEGVVSSCSKGTYLKGGWFGSEKVSWLSGADRDSEHLKGNLKSSSRSTSLSKVTVKGGSRFSKY